MPTEYLREFSHGGTLYPDILIFDTSTLGLPRDWQKQATEVANDHGSLVVLDGAHPTSREEGDEEVSYKQFGGLALKETMPWLFDAYYGQLLGLAQRKFGTEVTTNEKPNDVMSLLANSSGQRGEAHVDDAPIGLLLYPKPAKAGGRLFVTPDTKIRGYKNIIRWGMPIHIEANTGILFRGRNYAHVAERNVGSTDRIMVNMNYYLSGMVRDPSLQQYLGVQ